MEDYIIIRLGIPIPTEEEFKLVNDISEGEPIGGPVFPDQPGMSGIITILKSRLSSREISNRFQEISIGLIENSEGKDGNVFPVMVFKVDPTSFAYNNDMSQFLEWGKAFKKHLNIESSDEGKTQFTDSFTLDNLLDLMNERGGGFEKLSSKEQEIFKELSDNI
jgi:hypothetical protein